MPTLSPHWPAGESRWPACWRMRLHEPVNLAGGNVLDFVVRSEQESVPITDEVHLVTADFQHAVFVQCDDRLRIENVELGNAVVAGFAFVSRNGRSRRVVRVDVERDGSDRVERWRMNDGHVVRRPDG